MNIEKCSLVILCLIFYFTPIKAGNGENEKTIMDSIQTLTCVPTPTHHPINDKYYTERISIVNSQYSQWEKQMGIKNAIQKTVDLLNGKLPELPVPDGKSNPNFCSHWH